MNDDELKRGRRIFSFLNWITKFLKIWKHAL